MLGQPTDLRIGTKTPVADTAPSLDLFSRAVIFAGWTFANTSRLLDYLRTSMTTTTTITMNTISPPPMNIGGHSFLRLI
jgi:hypothetical protein